MKALAATSLDDAVRDAIASSTLQADPVCWPFLHAAVLDARIRGFDQVDRGKSEAQLRRRAFGTGCNHARARIFLTATVNGDLSDYDIGYLEARNRGEIIDHRRACGRIERSPDAPIDKQLIAVDLLDDC